MGNGVARDVLSCLLLFQCLLHGLTITTFGQDAYSPADIRSVGNNLYAWFAALHNKEAA